MVIAKDRKCRLTVGWIVGAAALCVVFAAGQAGATSPSCSFSLSGNAQKVVGGIVGPNSVAVDLTSNSTAPGYSTADFTPSGSLTVGQINTLSADFNIGGSDCGGGSPRFSIVTSAGNIFVYFGPTPSFTGCTYGWQNTGNVTASSDVRVDTSKIGGTFYDTWDDAVSLVGSATVSDISVVLDGGWTNARGQDVTIDNFRVNSCIMK